MNKAEQKKILSEMMQEDEKLGLYDEQKQETLEEAYLNKLIDEANKEFTLDRKLAKEVAIKFSKWQQEQNKKLYSEEEVEDLIYKVCGTVARLQGITLNGNHIDTAYKQFKKK
jgi:hypothetical protein